LNADLRAVLLATLAFGGCGLSIASPPDPGIDTTDHSGKQHLRFLVFGDSGTGKKDQYEVGRRMAAECVARGGCDFALMLGDNIYGGGVDPAREENGRIVFDRKFDERFEIPYEPVGPIEFWAVAGNHDWYSAATIEAEIAYTRQSSRWRMPASDFAVPRLPAWIRIYGLDTNSLRRGKKLGQVDRAAAALCGGDGWRIVLGHHPVYSSGPHSNRYGVYDAIEGPLLERLIEACDVHFYFSGHDHHQEHIQAPGFDQVIQGAASKLRKTHRVRRRSAGVTQLAAASIYGFALVDATPSNLEIRFFGYGDGRSYAGWHCRHYEIDDFDDANRRSRDCR
jgi:hypothetical protein